MLIFHHNNLKLKDISSNSIVKTFNLYKHNNRLNKLISNKQVNQLKRYNKLFNNWIKSTGEEPVFLNKTDIENNINRLIQYYKNNGYFDVKVEIDSIIKDNKAEILYKIDTDSIYTIALSEK